LETSLDKVELESIPEEETSVLVEESIEEKLEQERIAWDYYEPAWMRILKQIRKEKHQRCHELLMVDRRRQKLSEWKQRLEQMQYDLTSDAIYGFSKILDLERMGREGNPLGPRE